MTFLTPIASATKTGPFYELNIEFPHSSDDIPNIMLTIPEIHSLEGIIYEAKKKCKIPFTWEASLIDLKPELTETSGKIVAIFENFRDLYMRVITHGLPFPEEDDKIIFHYEGENILPRMNCTLKHLNLVFSEGIVQELLQNNGDSRFFIAPLAENTEDQL